MPNEDIKKRVVEILAEQFGVDEEKISSDTSIVNNLGADSLDQVELTMLFEDEFKLEISDEEAEKLQTVNDIVKFIQEKS